MSHSRWGNAGQRAGFRLTIHGAPSQGAVRLRTALHLQKSCLWHHPRSRLLCSATNPNDAQVVFTTHNTTLLDTTLLRRDQIWFTEKGPAGNTHLYPLSDFSPRKGEALAKGYLAGRYGAIPVLQDGLKL